MTRLLSLTLIVTLLATAGAGCGGVSQAGGGDQLSLVAYSTPREVYEQISPGFTGAGLTQSYGASGDQARAVIAGLPADVVALSLEPDIQKLVDAKLVAPGWNRDEFGGMVSRSVVVFAVRKGNPRNIRTWEDLIKPGVEVVTPNPVTSGGARWNVMAAYGAATRSGRDGLAYLKQLFDHVVVQDKSAREALQTFTAGKGDVLLAYENEAVMARQKQLELDYVVPERTILIENPIAVTTGAPAKARAFVDYLRSPPVQRVFADKGYRSVREDLVDPARYPEPAGLFTIEDVGGWEKAKAVVDALASE